MRTCDINKVGVVSSLLAIPPPQRKADWKTLFFGAVIDASFASASPQVFTGPDGFPYFALLTPDPYRAFEAYCLCNLAQAAVEGGFGAAINSHGEGADWVFSHGDLLTLHLFGSLEVANAPSPRKLPSREVLTAAETVLVGQPAESYLPSVTRKHIRRYLEDAVGIRNPGVYLMHRPRDNPPEQLVFSVSRGDFSSDEAFRSVLGAISWFLPRHYGVVTLGEPPTGRSDFEPL